MRTLTITALLLIVPAGVLGPGLALPALAQAQGAAGEEAAAGAAGEEGIRVPSLEGEEEGEGRTLADWYALGGWVMHGLVACSVLVVALVLERVISLRRGAVIPRKFMSNLMAHWHKREIQQVIGMCGSTEVSIARVLRAGLLHFEEGLARMEDAINYAGEHEATLLRRNLGVLAAIGNIATMIGLLGTVLGMIESFDIIAKTGTGDAREVAGGIFQALITTAAGLMVGIVAIAAHSWLRRKVEVLEIDLQETSFRLLEELSLDRESSEQTGEQRQPRGDLAPAEA